MKAKYINPFTDFGFKKLFGEEASKPLLIDFLNALLVDREKIVSLNFKNNEQLGITDSSRKAIFDIYCENENGEKFIVELQKAKQNYFKERTIYYSTFPIQEQAEKGEWNFNLKAVYCIGILDFIFTDYKTNENKDEVVHYINLKDQNGNIFYDKLTYIYLEMPNFKLIEKDIKTHLEKWLYFIKNIEDFESIPLLFKDEEKIFIKALETAKLANLDESERQKYELSLKVFRDNKNTFDYAIETAKSEGIIEGKIEGIKEGEQKGKIEGKLEGKLETAKQLKSLGISNDIISKSTGLSIEEINKI